MNKLKCIRKSREISIIDAAKSIGTDPGNLSRIENGKQIPGRDLALRIHSFYGGEIDLIDILMPEKNESAA